MYRAMKTIRVPSRIASLTAAQVQGFHFAVIISASYPCTSHVRWLLYIVVQQTLATSAVFSDYTNQEGVKA